MPARSSGCVGESGSGKSVTALALMGLSTFRPCARAAHGFAGRDLLACRPRAACAVGKDIAMIFQDPLASLNPCYTVDFPARSKPLRMHGTAEERGNAAVRRARALALLQQVEIPDPEARLGAYPHQFSGGMAQRVMIAMAIAWRPAATDRRRADHGARRHRSGAGLDLLVRLQRERGMALLLITHDLASSPRPRSASSSCMPGR